MCWRLWRRLSDDLGATGDEEHGGSALPPPAKKQKPSGVGHAPTAAAGAPTPKVPSPALEAVASKAGGVAAKPGPAAGLAAAADEAEFVISEGATLPKNCKKYSGWKVGLLEELFQYCEPRTFSSAKKQIDSLQNARQMLEFAFGIKAGLSEGKSDSITIHAMGGDLEKRILRRVARPLPSDRLPLAQTGHG